MLSDAVASRLAAGVDAVFRRTVLERPRRQSPEALGPNERSRHLEALVAELEPDAHVRAPEAWFPAPSAPTPRERLLERRRDAEVVDVRFESPHELVLPALGERWARYAPRNREVVARHLRGPGSGRPAVLLLHGYLAGNLALEERVWPTRWLLKRGLDPVFAALPFHGPRRRDPRRPPPFPAADPRFTIEGFRQAVADLRALTRWLRARGAPAVGVMGMSLGGYTAALLATLEELDFVVPFIPLASIADFAREGGRLVGTRSQRARQHALLEAVHAPISPLSRAPRVPPAGRLVLAARGDRVTPVSHARRIAEHFDAPLELFSGGHLLQLGRRSAFRAAARLLGELGWLT